MVEPDDYFDQKRALERNADVFLEINENQTICGGFLPEAAGDGQIYGLSLRRGGELRDNFREFLERVSFLS